MAAASSQTDPTTLDDLVVSLDGWSDADGDPQGAVYEWYVNQILDPQVTTNTFPSGRHAKGDEIYVRCTPDDGTSLGLAATSDTATVINTGSTVAACAIQSSSGMMRTGDTLTATLSGWDDVDGDPEGGTFEWSVNGGIIGAGDSLSSSAFVRGDTVEVSCTANDGSISGNAVKPRLSPSRTPHQRSEPVA